MDAREIGQLGRELMGFLAEFDDCFGRSESREHVRTYVRGQLSDLPRKSIEPIALAAGTPPRTLQRFLESVRWDEQRMRDRSQRIVARDHAHPSAIGGRDEAAVGRDAGVGVDLQDLGALRAHPEVHPGVPVEPEQLPAPKRQLPQAVEQR